MMVPIEVPPNTMANTMRSHEEDIYEDLCYVTLRLGRERDKALGLLPLEPVEKRDYCIKELVETERNYCDALNMLVTHFMQPLGKLLRADDSRVVFLHIKTLADIHGRFYGDLYKACSNSQQQPSAGSMASINSVVPVSGGSGRMSACFLVWKEKFVVYGEYCANLPKAQQLIDQICGRDPSVNQAMTKCQMKANDGKFKLRDLLSLPMQRVLKYHLLLSELIKSTPDTHDDYIGLQRAHSAMVDIGQYINEVKRDSETLEIIGVIQASIADLEMPDNTELKDYGRLLKDGELRIRSHDETRLKDRYVFVFDKVMLMCKSIRGEQYSYKEALILADYQVEDMPVQSTISKLTKQWSNGWYLVHRQNKSTFAFYAKTDEMKRKWIDAIERALDNVCPLACREGSTDHTFAMFTFGAPTVCADCDKLLRGTFFQGYQCTVCNIAVHKQCIATVRSCGAPSLPPRPPLPPSSPSPCAVSINSYSGDEDNARNSATDLRHRPVTLTVNNNHGPSPITNGNSRLTQVRALSSLDGEPGGRMLAFVTDDIIIVTNKTVEPIDGDSFDECLWEGRNTRTNEEGVFPASMVEEIDRNTSASSEDGGLRVSYEDPKDPIFGAYQPNQSGHKSMPSLDEYPWFAGSMDRETAQSILERLPIGAFLVRISPKQRSSYAISINYNGQVKHMRVCVTGDHHYYYLSESRYFGTVVELVQWYEANSLCESFNLVNTSLVIPYKNAGDLALSASDVAAACDSAPPTPATSPLVSITAAADSAPSLSPIAYAVAVYGFTGSSANLLSLRKGDRVAILSKAGEGKGWWKGQINERIGYFPLAYVTETKDFL